MFWLEGTALNITGGIVPGNSATGDGGVIYASGSSFVTLEGGIFEDNAAVNGGMLMVEASAEALIQGITCSGNSATDRGGAWNLGEDSTIEVGQREMVLLRFAAFVTGVATVPTRYRNLCWSCDIVTNPSNCMSARQYE